MRILLVSDIHANWPALQAIREDCDVCVCLGDIVDYGVEPGPCIEWVREHCRYAVRGNHDHAVAQRVNAQGATGFRWLTAVSRAVTLDRTTSAQRGFLADLPVTRSVWLGGKRYLFVHASPRDPMEEYAPASEAFWAERLINVDTDVICVGHTHQQYDIRIGSKRVINPGSVGLPRDGDPRVAYAVVENDAVELKRVDYPIDAAVAGIDASPLPDAAKSMMRQVLRTGKLTPATAIPESSSGDRRASG